MKEEVKSTEENVLNGKEAFDLYMKGRDQWNDWASEHDGWKVDFHSWEFSGEKLDFSSFVFPGPLTFKSAKFNCHRVSFNDAIFRNGYVDFTNSEFNCECLTFGKAKFSNQGVTFRGANFLNVDERISFQEATFSDGAGLVFERANCGDVDLNLKRVRIKSGFLQFDNNIIGRGNYELTDAELIGSRLYGNFEKFNLRRVNFDNADLREAHGYFLDDSSIIGTRFNSRTSDPYSILRRQYTGMNFFLILVATILAVIPYTFKAISWSMIGQIQEIIQRIAPSEAPLEWAPHSTFSVVVGWTEEKQWLAVTMTTIIVLYNVTRGWVTLNMSAIREAEERSQHSPTLEDYKLYFNIHKYFLSWFLLIIVYITFSRIVEIMLQPVFIPAM